MTHLLSPSPHRPTNPTSQPHSQLTIASAASYLRLLACLLGLKCHHCPHPKRPPCSLPLRCRRTPRGPSRNISCSEKPFRTMPARTHLPPLPPSLPGSALKGGDRVLILHLADSSGFSMHKIMSSADTVLLLPWKSGCFSFFFAPACPGLNFEQY